MENPTPDNTTMNAWITQDPDGYARFCKLVAEKLETHGVLSEEDAIIDTDGALSMPLHNWISDWTKGNPTTSSKQAHELVKDHIDNMAYDMHSRGTLTFTQTFTVPGGSVTVGGSIDCRINNLVALRAGYAYLRQQALQGYNDFLRDTKSRGATAESLKESKSGQGAKSTASNGDGETDWIDFDRITKGTDRQGNTEIRVYGGAWKQFGVRLWEDLYKDKPGQATFFGELGAGSHSYSGQFTAYLKDGSPKRVNKLKFNKEQ